MFIGTGLVLVTWGACLVAIVATGLLPALVLAGKWPGSSTLRAAIWWGLLSLAVVVLAVHLNAPLRSARAAWLIGLVVLGLGTAGLIAIRRRGLKLRVVRRRPMVPMYVGISVATVYLAAAALGPVTNYDTGLYHLGAIAYAGDFPTIPGLANVYFPFGYANAEFPLGAILGNGPWDGEGFRLLNGLIMALVAADLCVRSRARRLTPGFFVLAVGLTAGWVPMVALSDYWVTSPTSDSAVLALTIASSAYLVDAVASRREWAINAGTCVAISAIMVMLRPTMIVYAVTIVFALGVVYLVRRKRNSLHVRWAPLVLVAAGVFVAGAVTTARDYLLSGWLQYPLSVFSFRVDWLAPDPVDYRTATLGAARNPLDLWAAAEGWEWIPVWLTGLPRQWEFYELLALAATAVFLLRLAARSGLQTRYRPLMVAVLPSLVAVAFWFLLTPPSFRFIWGPLFTAVAIPAGWALWSLSLVKTPGHEQSLWVRLTAIGVALPLVAVPSFSAVLRFDPASVNDERTWSLGIDIPYAVTSIVDVPVSPRQLPSGLTVLVPTTSDQCWVNYPLCTPMPSTDLKPRGRDIAEGFRP